MRISTLFYSLKQGIISIFRNKWFTLASLATIGSCLFLFGIFYAVLTNFEHIVKTAEENVAVTVFFDKGIGEERIQQIGNLIIKRTEVAKVNYVSADEAWAEFSKEYLEGYVDGFTENPLADSANYEIYLSDVSQQSQLVSYIESIEGVRRVNKSEITATTLTGINSLLAYVSGSIIILLLAVSVFLISNTVTIGISVRKEEISIMKYIGATDFFVRSPFVFEGILIGFIGAAIPLVLVYYLYLLAVDFVSEQYAFLNQLAFLPVQDVFRNLIPVSLLVGVGIGFLGSFFTVRKHLRV